MQVASGSTVAETEALRTRLQAFLTSTPEGTPLAVLRLLRFNFAWSVYGPQQIPAAALHADSSARISSVDLEQSEGLTQLAALLGGQMQAPFANACAEPVNRPMVREVAFKSLFAYLRNAPEAAAFVEAHFGWLEQMVLTALTDTWSAVRKASARALGAALVPSLGLQRLCSLHDRLLRVSQRLLAEETASQPPPRTHAERPKHTRSGSDPSISPPRSLHSASVSTPCLHGAAGSASGEAPKRASAAPAVLPRGAAAGGWRAHEGVMLGLSSLLGGLSGDDAPPGSSAAEARP